MKTLQELEQMLIASNVAFVKMEKLRKKIKRRKQELKKLKGEHENSILVYGVAETEFRIAQEEKHQN